MAEAWLRDALAVLAAGEPAALVTIVAVEGSAPRAAGTRMVVTAARALGSIGGGALEFRAIAQARLLLDEPAGSRRVQDYPLGPLLGQCCGGRVRLQLEQLRAADAERLGADERLDDSRLRLTMIGAGHVGTAVARVLAGTPVVLDWCDTRPGFATGGAQAIDDAGAVALVASAGADAAVIILTHDHDLDYRLVAAALGGAAGFVGLIGSATKRARFVARMERDGSGAAAGRLVCPIGVPGICGKEPAVIAVAVAAQLLALPRHDR